MDLTPLYVVLGALARSLVGWANHSLADGKIDEFKVFNVELAVEEKKK